MTMSFSRLRAVWRGESFLHRRRLLARARRAAPMRHQHGQVALDLNLALAVRIGRTAPMRHQRGQARQLKSVLTE